jgi:DNA-binding CsgD family transcriptional regulator
MLTVRGGRRSLPRCARARRDICSNRPPRRIVEAVARESLGAAPINGYIARQDARHAARLPAPPGDSNSSRFGLTPREREILQLVVDGLSMKQVAARLELSYHTIDSHQRSI